jgi:hypothetical protein
MDKTAKKTRTVQVKIRPAEWQDFNNAMQPNALNKGMHIFLESRQGMKAYRLSDSSDPIKLQQEINRGVLWVACTGFDSDVQPIKKDR